ncbi:methyltransferase domain-containing protein [Mycobacterium sp. B14F4]|uniref:class I SAM-dependent methyltransferase n=1 Tax=Mycobacterium sp. B14F4 TaxID=3153565 RepID=UPI00325CE8C7
MTRHLDYRGLRRTEAENYARDFVPLIPAPLAADLIEAAAPEPGEFVVDVACGTGVVTRLAAERVGANGKVVGVDLVPEMLEVAAAASTPSGAPIDWRQGDAESLPLPDESYDLALCQLGLMFFADRLAALGEMRRVLSPGGRLAVNVPAPMPALFEIMCEALGRHIDPALPGFLRTVFSLDETALRGLIDAAHFHDVSVQSATRTLRLPPPDEFLWQYLRVTPIAGLVLAADEDRRQALEDDVVARWQDFVADGGLSVELTVVTATARAAPTGRRRSRT